MMVVKVEYEPSPLGTIKSDRPRVRIDDRKVKQKAFFVYDVDKDQIVKEWIENP
jgi:hypothetical protein